MIQPHFILYVAEQQRAMEFYTKTLGMSPRLHVKGMTEFRLGEAILGLMPETSASRLLGIELERFAPARITPRAELYLIVDDPAAFHERAIAAGATEISSLKSRDWGHEAAYSLDMDGHVVAFAREL
jgi:uncharacterized glyoxalase superfamily protein PhnB